MAAGKWERIQEIFLQAAELPVAERDAFLQRTCSGDAGERAEVESLLAADASDGAAIAVAIEAEVGALLDEHSPLVGTRLGPYRLLQEIGRGGMGSVYLGERDDEQYRKQVAIKVVKRGMDSTEVLARFRNERQILAGLEHPYIARLIDGGTTPDGRPFFVLEFVQGQPIDVYCREQSLRLGARLQLFLRVCEAVSYAHRALVVHRDLKPGNIFVAAEGIPKLLDFGVAKLLTLGNEPGLTALSAPVGPLTPEYASPEQIRGLPITTAADVYSLGAVLFELLTGKQAQPIVNRTPAEIERVVCHADTPRPSTVARDAGATLPFDADIDNIVLMAMRKEPERRYGSVGQLADDIQRYLAGRPVRARQDSLVYRGQKFVRRNLLAVGAACLVFAALVGGIGAATVQARRAESERQVADDQRRVAERERQRAESQRRIAEEERSLAEAEARVAKSEQDRSQRRLSQMLELANRSLFDVHSAIQQLPGATTARRQIVATTLRYLEDLSKDAGQDDELRFMLSVSYAKVADVLGNPTQPNLGDTKGALANYERSSQLLTPLLAKDPNRPKYVQQLLSAKIPLAALLVSSGDHDQALRVVGEAMPQAQRLPRLCPRDPQCHIAVSEVCSVAVNLLLNTDSGEALRYSQLQTTSLERALAAFPRNTDIQLALATAYSQEARVLNTRGQLSQAVTQYRQAMALREGKLRQDPADVLTRRSLMVTYGNLAGTLGSPLFFNLGDTAGSREYYGKALDIARDLARSDPNNQLAQYDLANALMFASVLDLPPTEWKQSLLNLQEADGILQKLLAADPNSLARLRVLAIVQEYEGRRLDSLGDASEGLRLARQSLVTTEKAQARVPADLSLVSQALASEGIIAEILARQGDREGALAMARKSIARVDRLSAPASDRDRATKAVAVAYQTLATVESILGDWPEARGAAERAVREWRSMIAAGSQRVDRRLAARAEALLQDCTSHLH